MLASTRSKFTFAIFYPFEAESFNSRGTASLRAHVEKALGKLFAPGVGDAVRRRAPVPTRTESTSGGDLGSVWQTRAFELACLEEARRSDEQTSELQSLIRISYAVLFLNKQLLFISKLL